MGTCSVGGWGVVLVDGVGVRVGLTELGLGDVEKKRRKFRKYNKKRKCFNFFLFDSNIAARKKN